MPPPKQSISEFTERGGSIPKPTPAFLIIILSRHKFYVRPYDEQNESQ